MSDNNLFEGTVIFVIGNVEQKTLDILKNGRANITMFSKDSATHFIVGKTYDESQILEAKELYEKPTVNEQWVVNSMRLGKLLPVKPYDPLMAGRFFHSCIFTMYQVDPQDRLKLYSMITLYGGIVQKDLDNKVTHLISVGPQSVAIKVAALTKNKVTIITPDWIQQCLRHRRLIEPEPYHPSLLNLSGQPPSKITLMPTSIVGEKSQLIRGSIQTNVRPTRPVVQMQHTPQQINEIIQSQIQQQQLQEKAKQRAAAAAAAQGPNSMMNNPQISQQMQQIPIQQSQSQLAQSLSKPITVTTTAPTQTVTSQADSNIPSLDHIQQIQQPHVVMPQQQAQAQPQQIIQQTQQQQQQQNVPVQQIQQQTVNPGQQSIQRQLSLQQLEATRNQKIQMISQQLQQSSTNQQVLNVQQQQQQFQQHKQFQNQQQMVLQNQQQPPQVMQNQQVQQQQQFLKVQQQQQQTVVQPQQAQCNMVGQQQQNNIIQAPGNNMQQQPNNNNNNIQTLNIQQSGGPIQTQTNIPQHGGNIVQQFTSPMKQIINPNMQQNLHQQQPPPPQQQQQPQQQFVVNQGNLKSISQSQGGVGSNFIQIIQQGQNQQIIQIQNPESGQMQQKVLNQSIHSNQQNVVSSINSQGNPQNVQNLQINQQQFQQTTQTQQNINLQNQNNRQQQNIVIINQVQNSQQVIQNQRFPNPNQIKQQQQQQITGQQIIQQKLISTPGDQNLPSMSQNMGQQQQNPQIIQVHQSPIVGSSVQHQQQQQNVAEIIDQKIQPTTNVVHIQQQGPPGHAGLTQAQAVQQIAQQLQSGSAEIISNTMNPQNLQPVPSMNQGQGINIVQQQNIQGNPAASPQIPQLPQPQWIPQSPTQQQSQSPVIQQTVQHHIITTNQGAPLTGGQFIRATTGSRMDTHIYLDAQSSAQFQKMDQSQKKEYLEKLHIQQQQQHQRGVVFGNVQPRANAPNVLPGARPQHHIVIRSQMPTGLTPQQQMQWIQQNRQRQFVIRPGAPGNQQAIPGQQGQTVPAQYQIDPNATPQQQQILRQQQQQNFQRLQQLQQNQKIQGQPTSNSPRGPNFVSSNEPIDGIQMPMDSSNKTKTALANMLSNRLGNNGGVPQIVEQPVEQSASGTLRMMTAQHNASLSVPGMPPGVVRTQQDMIVLQQQQQQQQQQIQPQIVGNQQIVQGHPQLQQRRQLGNITNAGKPQVIVTNQVQSNSQVMISTAQNANMKSPVAVQFSPGRSPAITNRPQFYGHNPNLKLPPDLFLLGCHFFIVEYTETNVEEIPGWKQTIKHHGGEIEACYNARVTHVLCRTQKHGIVMQAIRDNKRCVTVYWLNDIILKKMVLPPWQAIHLPSPSIFGNMKPGTKHIITTLGFEGDERERVKSMIEESGAKSTSYMNRQNTVVVCKKVDQNHKKYQHAKEFNIPMVNLVWLSDLLLGNISAISLYDSPKYQQFNLPQPLRIDHTVVMPLMNAWKAPINLTQESHERLKRSQLDPSPQKPKKLRTIPFLETIADEVNCIRQPEPNNIPVVMFSQVDNVEGLSRAVISLGGRVTTDINEMTHLVMTNPSRSMKFLQSLCVSKYIVKSLWLEESVKAGFFQPEDNFWATELNGNFKCNIPAVVMSPIRKKLFQNRVFFITPSVIPGPTYLRWMIEQCGGKWEPNRRSIMKIHELNQQAPNSYIIISCPDDLHLLNFKHFVCYVCTSEFILQSIMTQTIDFLKSELQLTR